MAEFYVAPDPLTGGVPGSGVPAGSPTGDGSAAAPYDMATAWANTTDEDDLIRQLPGIYRGADSMIVVPTNTHHVTLRAIQPGTGNRIDGEQTNQTVVIDGRDAIPAMECIALDGITAHDSSANGINVEGAQCVSLLNFVLWTDSWPTKPYGNHKPIAISSDSDSILLDTFAVFGQCDRKLLSISGSSGITDPDAEAPVFNTTVRNGWLRWDGNYLGDNTNDGNRGALFPMYRAHNVLCEDMILTLGGGTGVLPPVGTDPNADLDPNLIGSDTPCNFSSRVRYDRTHLRRIAMPLRADQRINYGQGVRITSGTGPDPTGPEGDKDYSWLTIEDMTIAMDAGTATWGRHYNLGTNVFPDAYPGGTRNSVRGLRISNATTQFTNQISADWAERTPIETLDAGNPVSPGKLPLGGQRHPLAQRIIEACGLTAWDVPNEYQLGGDWSQLYT